MALDIQSIIVPLKPYPDGTPKDKLDRTDTFLAPNGRYHGECKFGPMDWSKIPESHRLVLAVLTEVEGFRYRIFRAAKQKEIQDFFWK